MKKSDLYEVAVKIFGIYLIVSFVLSLKEPVSLLFYSGIINSMGEKGSFLITEILIYIFRICLVLVPTFFFIFRTKSISKIICNSTDYEEQVSLITDKRSALEIAFVMVGLLTIILALPGFLYLLTNNIILVQADLPVKNYDTRSLFTSVFEILIGIGVIYFRTPFSSFLLKKTS